MLKCPHCGGEFKDEGRAKGGRKARHTLDSEQAKRMAEKRWGPRKTTEKGKGR